MVLFAVSSVTYAGEIKFGAKAGVNIANWVGEDVEEEDKTLRIGIVGGGFVTVPLSDQFSLQPELLISMKGAKYEGELFGQSFESAMKLTYIEVPVLAKLNILTEGSVKPNLYLGPSIGVKMSATAEAVVAGVSTEVDIEDINSLDLGLALGGGIDVEVGEGKVTLDVRYTMGLTNIPDTEPEVDIKNSVISIMAGYRF